MSGAVPPASLVGIWGRHACQSLCQSLMSENSLPLLVSAVSICFCFKLASVRFSTRRGHVAKPLQLFGIVTHVSVGLFNVR